MSIIDFFFQPRCKICKAQIRKGALCHFCIERLCAEEKPSKKTLKIGDKVIPVYYLFRYNSEIVKELLFALKRKGDKGLFSYAARLYEKSVPQDLNRCAVVNVPRSKKNIKKYGYDHVKEPCRIMCDSNENLMYMMLLKRHGGAKEQKKLNAEHRIKNVHSKFSAIKKDTPENILLVDDVVTTGSTASECVMTLMKEYPHANIKCVFLASQET